jgi:hypothetical protein
MNNATLTDNTISHIAQLLQMAMLTGTDIVDHFRLAQFVVEDGKIDIAPDYYENFQENIQRMLDEAKNYADSLSEDSTTEE